MFTDEALSELVGHDLTLEPDNSRTNDPIGSITCMWADRSDPNSQSVVEISAIQTSILDGASLTPEEAKWFEESECTGFGCDWQIPGEDLWVGGTVLVPGYDRPAVNTLAGELTAVVTQAASPVEHITLDRSGWLAGMTCESAAEEIGGISGKEYVVSDSYDGGHPPSVQSVLASRALHADTCMLTTPEGRTVLLMIGPGGAAFERAPETPMESPIDGITITTGLQPIGQSSLEGAWLNDGVNVMTVGYNGFYPVTQALPMTAEELKPFVMYFKAAPRM